MHRLDDVQARELTLASVGAINRRDHLWSVDAVRCLVSDERTRMVAIDTCAAILLRGVPRGALDPSVRIPVAVPTAQGDERAAEVASEVLSGLACADDHRVAAALGVLSEDQQFDAVMVLARAAAAWIDMYMGIDGDTVDAYYAISKAEMT